MMALAGAWRWVSFDKPKPSTAATTGFAFQRSVSNLLERYDE